MYLTHEDTSLQVRYWPAKHLRSELASVLFVHFKMSVFFLSLNRNLTVHVFSMPKHLVGSLQRMCGEEIQGNQFFIPLSVLFCYTSGND